MPFSLQGRSQRRGFAAERQGTVEKTEALLLGAPVGIGKRAARFGVAERRRKRSREVNKIARPATGKPARGDCGGEGGTKIRYRYRTSALAGRWRDSREDALRDAVNAHQALADPSAPGGLDWLVHGEIEEAESASALVERIQRH